jgi:putative tricarboxylic transport membrane protein
VSEPGRAAPERSGAARPYWLGLVVIALGAVWLGGARTLPQAATYAVIGPGMFVTLVGGGLVVLGVLLLVAVARGERFEPQDAEDADPERPTAWPAFGLTTLAAALPIAVLRPLGFPLAAALTFALVARAFGSRRPAKDLGIGVALGVACWLLFARLLGLELPGPLPRLFR